MQRRPLFWCLVSVLCMGAALFFWHLGDQWEAERAAKQTPPKTSSPVPHALAPGVKSSTPLAVANPADPRLPYRLRNTDQPVGKLVHNEKGILLANALIDTGKPLDLAIPDRLKAPANNGTYIVQSKTMLNDQFRATLQSAGAKIVAYVPNNAYLVRVSDAGAQQLSADSQTQSVLPFEPYYKLDAPVLKQVMMDPDGRAPSGGLKVLVFSDAYQATVQGIQASGAEVVGQESSPFGQVLTVHPLKGTIPEVASLPGVQAVSGAHLRILANDLVRPRLGVALDSVTPTNYLGLTGSNVTVAIIDTGVDATHPDFQGKTITSDTNTSLTDTIGHGTHVAGTIFGNGSKSSTVTSAQGSVTNANFRGIATNANGFVLIFDASSDSYEQEQSALGGAFISNNSWNYADDSAYDIAAASYDAAVRDALPEVTGSQAMVYVFAAGDDGGGPDDGSTGNSDTILSPATAKNVITVGAIEQPRFITVTNMSVGSDGTTNTVTNTLFQGESDSSNQVTAFSSRGNVGINVEGDAGRFKPDLVAPGTFVISTRSTNWNTAAYYNPTNKTFSIFPNELVVSNSVDGFPPIALPDNVVGLSITLITNRLSPNPFPTLPIYVGTAPGLTAKNALFTGSSPTVSLPNGTVVLSPGNSIYFTVGNTTTQSVSFDAVITMLTTNDTGKYIALSNLNNGLAPYYRYESGTSQAAAGVSGMLACLQEFFQQLHTNASPALMKAMLINGARPLPSYDLQVTTPLNSQGWGLPNMPNTIPAALTNLMSTNPVGSMPVQFFDQDPTNALATAQSLTRNVALTSDAQGQDMRITLVWTDPPGNPITGVKLVNDLDLIVTNLDTGEVFYGNDIPTQSDYTEATETNGVPNIDSINNVENVFLQAPLGTNYSVTVLGRRVNVNAVTANHSGIVQDYALVISSGDAGSVASPFTVTNANPKIIAINNPAVSNLTVVTNGVPLFNQRVGANSQFSGLTNGTAAQWNFYIYTNTPPPATVNSNNFTNVAILTFVPPELSLPRMGASAEIAPPATEASRFAGADIDIYVSTNSALTNLDTNVIASAFTSTTRTGTEKVLITNSAPGMVYYIGVKAEDQNGGQFALFGVSTDKPFDQTDANGNVIVTMLSSFPVVIPPGGPSNPNHALLLGVSTSSIIIRKAVVTNTVQHQEYGDLIGTLTHGQKSAVLNNHSFFTNTVDVGEALVYDDSGENDTPTSRRSDGPGTLQNFTGDEASAGIWMFTMVNDSSLTDTGQINGLTIYLEPQTGSNSFVRNIQSNSFFYDFVDVPPNATNLSISLSGFTSTLDLYIKQGTFPTSSNFDTFAVIQPPGGTLSVGKFSSPPLNAGRYFYGIFNPGVTAQTVTITIQVDQSLAPAGAETFLSGSSQAVIDDAVTYSTNHVGINSQVVSAEVGVRIIHPRESDLALTLISPSGTRVLLAENRGGLDTNGYGSGFDITNVFPPSVAGGQAVNTTNINAGTNFGTLIVNYDFLQEPDQMTVYYDGALIFNTGLVPGVGNFSVNFGPGSSTNVVITMNEFGNTNATTEWSYQASVVTRTTSFATFTENTNLAAVPIKFAVPPFGAGAAFIPPQTNFLSSFEGITATNYISPQKIDGWTVADTNPVMVVTVPAFADTGSNVLALHGGTITRTMSNLVVGQNYTLTFANHGRPSQDPAGWWKGDSVRDYSDFSDNLVDVGSPAVVVTNGLVGQAFSFSGSAPKLRTPDSPVLALSNSISAECWLFQYNPPSLNAGLLERDDDSGHQTYDLGVYNGQLVWSIDNQGPAPQILSPIGTGVWVHAAGTFDVTTHLMKEYINGQLVGTLNTGTVGLTGPLGSGAGVGIGNTGQNSAAANFPFAGLIDEMTLYSNALTAAQIQDIYAAGSAGKNPVGLAPAVTASVVLGGHTNTISGVDQWTTNVYSFTATSASMTLTISPDQNDDGFGTHVRDGMLLDSFRLIKDASPNPTNYYLPEESLDKLVGEPSQGDWLLEVLDNRTGATNNGPLLVSWELNLVLADTVPTAIPISPAVSQTNSVPPNSIVYYQVDVPAWANFATNILTSGSPLQLLFNQSVLPGTNASDATLLAAPGTSLLSGSTTPPLLPGRRYYLGVQNTSSNTVGNFTLEVDFDITRLTNAVPYNGVIAQGNVPRYFSFDVDSNAVETFFQIVSTTGNLELVVSKNAPLPDTVNFDFQTSGSIPQLIAVPTNAAPVPPLPLPTMGTNRWYLGVFNADNTSVTYTIMATEAGQPNIINLTNGVPYTITNAPPGPALTNFYLFSITNNAAAVLFELSKLNGNVDLNVDPGAIPYAPSFFASSALPGTNNEQVVIRTNISSLATRITNSIQTNWYIGVPNNTTSNVTYTILATASTNSVLTNSQGLQLQTSVTTTGGTSTITLTFATILGGYYEIQSSPDLVTWTTLQTTHASGTTITFSQPISRTSNLFFRVVQVPGP